MKVQVSLKEDCFCMVINDNRGKIFISAVQTKSLTIQYWCIYKGLLRSWWCAIFFPVFFSTFLLKLNVIPPVKRDRSDSFINTNSMKINKWTKNRIVMVNKDREIISGSWKQVRVIHKYKYSRVEFIHKYKYSSQDLIFTWIIMNGNKRVMFSFSLCCVMQYFQVLNKILT